MQTKEKIELLDWLFNADFEDEDNNYNTNRLSNYGEKE